MPSAMKPLISLQLQEVRREFEPGDELECSYQVDAVDPREIQAIETSVLWRTEGKGEEDMAVHFFRRRVPADVPSGDLRELDTFRTVLPNSPLSYEGAILKLFWCVRVRVFMKGGKDGFAELRFRLGHVPPAQRIDAPAVARTGSATTGERARETSGDGF